jgi:hypothetical protein
MLLTCFPLPYLQRLSNSEQKGFDKYISDKDYDKLHAMIAFSGEV